MGRDTGISWCDHTFNPWRGCTKVHEGCAHCYAERGSKRNPSVLGIWGPHGTRVVAAESAWEEPKRWNDRAAKRGVRERVFCASLADVFEDWQGGFTDHNGRELRRCEYCSTLFSGAETCGRCNPPRTSVMATDTDVRARLFALIDATPWLDWLLLTKRPENVRRMWVREFTWVETGDRVWQYEGPPGTRRFRGIAREDGTIPTFSLPGGFTVSATDGRFEERGAGERATIAECKAEVEQRNLFRPNVWLGTSISLQEHADRQCEELERCADLCPVQFVSAEPLLGEIVVPESWLRSTRGRRWVIAGCESGPRARRCNLRWVRDIRDQCAVSRVPCFIKQLGVAPVHEAAGGDTTHPSYNEMGWSEETPHGRLSHHAGHLHLKDSKGGDWSEWPADLRVRQFPEVANG